jgi:hypothetical protein
MQYLQPNRFALSRANKLITLALLTSLSANVAWAQAADAAPDAAPTQSAPASAVTVDAKAQEPAAAQVPAQAAQQPATEGGGKLQTQAAAPSPVKVSYTLNYPNGGALKETPTEVRIVRPQNTQRAVAGQVALNVIMLALGGGAGVSGFSKNDLKGNEITDLVDRQNIQNPIPTAFVSRVDTLVSNWLKDNAEYQTKAYKNALMVAGGSSKLVYESLSGEGADKFKLSTDLMIYKRRESANFLSFSPVVSLSCGNSSAALASEQDWAKDNWRLVKTELDAALKSCEERLLAQLPDLLKD